MTGNNNLRIKRTPQRARPPGCGLALVFAFSGEAREPERMPGRNELSESRSDDPKCQRTPYATVEMQNRIKSVYIATSNSCRGVGAALAESSAPTVPKVRRLA